MIVALVGVITSTAQSVVPWLLVGAIWLLLASAVKVLHGREADKEASSKKNHEGLVAALHVVQALAGHICAIKKEDLDTTVRVTFHRIVPLEKAPDDLGQAEEIEQLVNYVGGNADGVGRRFSIRSGITGAAIRGNTPIWCERVNSDAAAYVKELKEQWAYTEHDAKKMSTDRFSCYAVPILHGNRTLGVVFMDSDKAQLFAGAEVQQTILVACGGINRYVGERYGT